VVGLVLRYRTLAKLRGTYVDSLLEFAVPAERDCGDGGQGASGDAQRWAIHAEWNQLSVETGRLSASKPALQCIPRDPEPIYQRDDDEEGSVRAWTGEGASSSTSTSTSTSSSSTTSTSTSTSSTSGGGGGGGGGGRGGGGSSGVQVLNVRSAFVASPGHTLVAVDYSQIEMRVLAHFCQDAKLSALFRDPAGDVYVQVASSLLRKPPVEVTVRERDLAKTCCLGIIYGMGVRELARRYKVSEHVAGRFVGSFHEAFPGVRAWAIAVKRRCHDEGFVTTIANRRRQVPRAAPGDGAGRARAERQAVNSVVQGSASDLLKLAMVRIHQHLETPRGEGGGGGEGGEGGGGGGGAANAGAGEAAWGGARLLLQVHDELIFDVAAQPRAITALVAVLRDCMEREVVEVLGLRVPLAVKVSPKPWHSILGL